VLGLCLAAAIIPAVPGIERLFPEDRHQPVVSETGSQTFLSAPACSLTRDDLCLHPSHAAAAAGVLAIEPAERREREAARRELVTETPVPESQAAPQPASEQATDIVTWASMEVREGDTLLGLAAWFQVSPFDLAVANDIAVDSYLYTGTTIVIPIPDYEFVAPPAPDIVITLEVPAATPPPQPPTAGIIVAPAPAPPPATAPPSSGSWTKDDAVSAICSLPWDCVRMVAIAGCESGLRANAYNPAGYYGLFQINYAFEGWDNPWINAQVAYETKYLPALQKGGDGTSPWPVCRYY
jgi:hypothetical protein